MTRNDTFLRQQKTRHPFHPIIHPMTRREHQPPRVIQVAETEVISGAPTGACARLEAEQ